MIVRVFFFSMFLVITGASMGLAYQESPVSNGGAIQGHVRILGDTPKTDGV